jgi:hypothetical protein
LSADQQRRLRAISLQTRICGLAPPSAASPDELFAELRKSLRNAFDEGRLTTKPHEIFKMLKKSPTARGETEIVGGEKNFHRTPNKAHFTRADGAWFDFAIAVVRASAGETVTLAYDFEIRFPEHVGPAFVRFDLNQPGHDNETVGLRSHLHPGSDDLSVPSPLMSPLEILDVFLYGLALPEKPRAK